MRENDIRNDGIIEIGNALSNLTKLTYVNLDLDDIRISNAGFGVILENVELLNNDCEIILDARNNIVGGSGLSEYE